MRWTDFTFSPTKSLFYAFSGEKVELLKEGGRRESMFIEYLLLIAWHCSVHSLCELYNLH